MTNAPLTQTPASPAKKFLAPLPNRFQLQKEQWTMTDKAWLERDAVTGKPNFIATLASVADLANAVDGDPASPTYGWQKSNPYRSGICSSVCLVHSA